MFKFYLTPNPRLLSDLCMRGLGVGQDSWVCTRLPSSPVLSHVSSMITPKLSPGVKIDLKLPSVERLSGKLWAEETFPFGGGREAGLAAMEEARSKRTKLLVEDRRMQWP